MPIMNKKYRNLTESEISILTQNGCRAEHWESVEVAPGFQPGRLSEVYFGGKIRLGANNGTVTGKEPVARPCGIRHAALYNCTVGDQCLISNIGRYIANYEIGDGVILENVGELYCEAESAFGNGTAVSVINEGGGREVPIYDELTAQTAYIMAMYRQRSQTIRQMESLIARKVAEKTSARGSLGNHSSVINTTSLVNVRIGEHATVNGAMQLSNGSINSSAEAPSFVGSGVTARDFILAHGARVDTGSMLRHCFVGEGVLIENGFSAENSLFFANCHCTHGEACAVFAGPYTVSHHRASLLIAGYFSFFNAGSGANQSNHLYKTGPVHQGIHLRGCKFGSDAYVLLPACTGVFTLVTGRHYNHHDTDHMPFSYLVEEDGDSLLVPGINLRSIGTSRDVGKWPKRDRRKGAASDLIHYEMMNPYTAGKILKAIKICEFLMAKYPGVEVLNWNRVKIKLPSLRRGLLLYTQALRGYLGSLFGATGTELWQPPRELPDPEQYEWVDLAGMLLPRRRLSTLLEAIDTRQIDNLEELHRQLRELYNQYKSDERAWAWHALSILLDKPVSQITPDDIAAVVRQGKKDRAQLDAAIKQDGNRDRALMMAVGYGLDFDQEKEADFRAVRGN